MGRHIGSTLEMKSLLCGVLWLIFMLDEKVVVDGREDYKTDTDTYPFLAWLSVGCTGSLVGNKVYTSAKCFYKDENYMEMRKRRGRTGCGIALFKSNPGRYDPYNDKKEPSIKRNITKIERYNHDLAVLHLDGPVDTAPVKVSSSRIKKGDIVKAVGYDLVGHYDPHISHRDLRVRKSHNISSKKWKVIETQVDSSTRSACSRNRNTRGGPLLVWRNGWELLGTLYCDKDFNIWKSVFGIHNKDDKDDKWNSVSSPGPKLGE